MSNQLAVRESITVGEPAGVHLTKTGLTFSRAIPIDEWVAFGQQLKKIEGAIQWYIGDWLNYGEKAYGEKYVEALEATGYDYGSLRNMKSVSQAIELSRRRDNLSWSHHAEVAPLEPEQQDKLLDWAEQAEASVKELRAEVKQKNQPAPAPELTEVRNLREWLKAECPGLDAIIQPHVKYGEESTTFNLETRDITTAEVKTVCKLLWESQKKRTP